MSSMPVDQPNLPAEEEFSDTELLFISESPQRLFPENQNSNFGLLRKVLSSQPQETIDLLSQLVIQSYVESATATNGYMDRWESQMGLPVAPLGHTEAQRRGWVSSRRLIDLFSVSRIRQVVESFLNFTAGGVPTSITVGGIPTSAGGFTLYGEGGTASSQYRLYFNPQTYSYEVWIVNSSTPDLVTLTRELKFITPAGQTVTIDNSKTAIIDYSRTIKNKQPNMYFKLDGNAFDSSGYTNHGTPFGTFTTVASPGLLVAGKNDDSSARTFNGTTAYFLVSDIEQLDLGDFMTLELWYKPNSITGTQVIMDKGTGAYRLRLVSGALEFSQGNGAQIMISPFVLTVGQTYHIVFRRAGNAKMSMVINNVDRSGPVLSTVALVNAPTDLIVGANDAENAGFLNGTADEIAAYARYLTDAEITENYNAGKLINP